MVVQVFTMIAQAFAQFFSTYAMLDLALGISSFAVIAIAMWSITRFLILPILGGHYSISDGDMDILTETVTETTTVADKPQRAANGRHTVRHSTTRTSSRTSRKKVPRQ